MIYYRKHNVLHAPNKCSCVHSTEAQNVLHRNCNGRDFPTRQPHLIAYFPIYSSKRDRYKIETSRLFIYFIFYGTGFVVGIKWIRRTCNNAFISIFLHCALNRFTDDQYYIIKQTILIQLGNYFLSANPKSVLNNNTRQLFW